MGIPAEVSRIIPGAPRYAMVDVRIDQAALDRITAEIRSIPGAMERLMPPALNDAAREMRSWFARRFADRMGLRRKRSITDRLTLTPKASAGSLSAGVRIGLTRLTIASFRDVQQVPSGVTWSTGGSRLRGGFIPRAFIRKHAWNWRSVQYLDNMQVWRRAGPMGRTAQLVPRYPLFVMRGPSLAYAFDEDPAFVADAESTGQAILEKKVAQQVNRILKT